MTTPAALLRLPPPLGGAFARVVKGAAGRLVMPGPAERPAVDGRRMMVTSVIATARRDRDGDIVVPAGAILDDHKINPVVMYYHGKSGNLPIGKAEDPDRNYTVRLAGDRLVADTYFAQSNRFACDVFDLIAEDVLRGTSVGFDPVACKAIGPQPDADTRPPMRYDAWRMFEYSHAPIGVNREALTVAVHKALDNTRRMHPVLVEALRPYAAARKPQVTVPALPREVTKAMPTDDAMNGAEDPTVVPDEAPAGGDTPPTAAAFYDYAQAISDATAAFEAATGKSEHVPSHKEIDRVLADAEKFTAKLTAHADKVQASLGGAGDDEADADDVDFDEEPDDDELAPVQKARDGGLIVKSYTPTRWGPRDLARAARQAAAGPPPDAARLKALAARIAANDKRIRAEKAAAEKDARLKDRNEARARGDY